MTINMNNGFSFEGEVSTSAVSVNCQWKKLLVLTPKEAQPRAAFDTSVVTAVSESIQTFGGCKYHSAKEEKSG